MTHIHHRLARFYLNKTSTMSFNDILGARAKFEKMSHSQHGPRIAHVQDIPISDDVSVRHYSQAASRSDQPKPVMIYFHGGGWALGSADTHDSVCRNICRAANIDVVSVNYRLAPEYPFPAPIEDGLAVIDWLKGQAESLSVDPSKLFIGGDSAGGQITAQLAAKLGAANIRGIVLIYPALDPALTTPSIDKYAEGYFLTKKMGQNFWRLYLQNAPADVSVWPLPAEQLKKFPPTLHIGAEQDILIDEGVSFIRQLQELGVDAESVVYPDMLHGFLQFPAIVSSKKAAFSRIAKFIEVNKI